MIQQAAFLFPEQQTLPPKGPNNHKIDILQGARPVNVRLIGTPIFKQEIEKLGSEIWLQVMRHSTSNLSSPPLLVKKKGGSWRFCIGTGPKINL